jgi:hypothetical protein
MFHSKDLPESLGFALDIVAAAVRADGLKALISIIALFCKVIAIEP